MYYKEKKEIIQQIIGDNTNEDEVIEALMDKIIKES